MREIGLTQRLRHAFGNSFLCDSDTLEIQEADAPAKSEKVTFTEMDRVPLQNGDTSSAMQGFQFRRAAAPLRNGDTCETG